MQAQEFLSEISGYVEARPRRSAERPNRLATIDPAYTSGLPKVTFDGETELTVKTYTYADSYTPTASDRVLMMPVGTTYMIMCKVVS